MSKYRIFNPDTKDITVKRGDKFYTVKSGDYSKYYPERIALHIAKYLIDRLLHKKNIPTHLKPERNKVLSTILS